MSEKQQQIIGTFEKMLPKMDEHELDRLLSFSEGMAFMKDKQQEEPTTEKGA